MNTLARVTLTFLLLQSVASTVAWACSCMGTDETPEELLAAHGKVFVGEVLDGPHARGCGFVQSSTDPVTYTLAVTEAFKGVEEGDRIKLETAASGASCGVEMVVGESRLIYTDDDRVGSCDPGGRAADSSAEIEALRAAVAE
ncbi:MAG: hypothetical protein Q7U06_01315 [Pseudomonadota bacterium]|nr:hypothetical protein [Pseudomonadota bacterium]